ncbi:MAG TPA: hypothetical protein VK922_01685 [Gemmatimonadaceae bacterium]|nr:hypothetical protein [Gemmatimonadaceae bacterium]
MNTLRSFLRPRTLVAIAAAGVLAACADDTAVGPDAQPPVVAKAAGSPAETIALSRVVATLQRVTARYHDLDVAIADGFVLLHPCEDRPGEGPVGTVYVHFGRLLDGIADPSSPDALVYEPAGPSGRPKLVGVEFAIPYVLWSDPAPPEFMGHAFQREDEFGVFGLHIWVWRNNPNGLFEEANPKVSCGPEA